MNDKTEFLETIPSAETHDISCSKIVSIYAFDNLEQSASQEHSNILLNTPFQVNFRDNQYRLIVGEQRFQAVLERPIPFVKCMVYYDLSDIQEIQLRYSSDFKIKEPSLFIRLKIYQTLRIALVEQESTGDFKSPLQEKASQILRVSTRQVRNYNTVLDYCTKEEWDLIRQGKLNLKQAYDLAAVRKYRQPEGLPIL